MNPLTADFFGNLNTWINPAALLWSSMVCIGALMVLNLLVAGKNGWAWPTVQFFVKTVRLLLRGIAGMIREVASGQEDTGSWDEE